MCDIVVKKNTFVKILTFSILDVIMNVYDFPINKFMYMIGKSAEKIERTVFLERRKIWVF